MVNADNLPELFEYFGNIHMHTTHSDGFGSFEDLIDGVDIGAA